MPYYDFRCRNCGTVHERHRPVAKRNHTTICPQCGWIARRLFAPCAINSKTLSEHGFFNMVGNELNPTPEERPDLYRVEERCYALGGWKKD